MQTNSSITKLKFFLWKIRAASRRRKGGNAELNCLSNFWNSDREFVSEPHKTLKNKEKLKIFQKIKIFLMKNSCWKGGDRRRKLVSERQKKLQKLICRDDQLTWNENFSYEKFLLRVEQEKEGVQNWILFQTVTNSDREFEIELMLNRTRNCHKLKNKENFIRADEFSFRRRK